MDAVFVGVMVLLILFQIPRGNEYLKAGAADTSPSSPERCTHPGASVCLPLRHAHGRVRRIDAVLRCSTEPSWSREFWQSGASSGTRLFLLGRCCEVLGLQSEFDPRDSGRPVGGVHRRVADRQGIQHSGRSGRADHVIGAAAQQLDASSAAAPQPDPRSKGPLMTDVTPTGPMAGKTVLVTGGTAGIGKATALGLATMGAHLAITGRDRARTEDAAREIRAAGGGPVGRVRRGPVLPVGGAAAGGRGAPASAGSMCWSTTSVATGTPGTSPPTGSSAPSPSTISRRSCSPTCSSTGCSRAPLRAWSRSRPTRRRWGASTSTTSRASGRYSGARAYNQSKLANVLFTYELARRLRGTAVTANALHPGVVRTSFGAEDPAVVQRLFIPFLRPS